MISYHLIDKHTLNYSSGHSLATHHSNNNNNNKE